MPLLSRVLSLALSAALPLQAAPLSLPKAVKAAPGIPALRVVSPAAVLAPAKAAPVLAPASVSAKAEAALAIPVIAAETPAGAAKAEAALPFDGGVRRAGAESETLGGVSAPSPLAPASADGRGSESLPPAPAERPLKKPFFIRHYGIARWTVRPVVRAFYKASVHGLENLPAGPAVIVPNHVSYMDAVLVSFAANRPMRFMMERKIYDQLNWFGLMRSVGAIPVSKDDSPATIEATLQLARRAVAGGETVVIFPEGRLTGTGFMDGFRPGFMRIVAGTRTPVVPAHLDGMWGSIFSRQVGPSVIARVLKGPRPMQVTFGKPLSVEEATPQRARLEVSLLGAKAMEARVRAARKTLAREFVRSAKKHWFRTAITDTFNMTFTFGKTMAGVVLLSQRLDAAIPGEKNVAVLIPTSSGAALANVALAAIGRVTVNLNYTSSPELLEHVMKKTEAKTIVTSRRAVGELQKYKKDFALPNANIVYLEDLPAASTVQKLLKFLELTLRTGAGIERRYLSKAATSLDDVATIIATSGTTSAPKGAMLSHLNVVSNVEMNREVLPWSKKDVLLGVLPFFHSFGYTVAMWMPLLSGMTGAYHAKPMDHENVAKLALRVKPTLLFGTPGFLARYAEKLEANVFATLRLAVAGAAKLTPEIANAFLEKFGIKALEGFGTTELSPGVAVSVPDASGQKGSAEGSVGRALPGQALKVVDSNGKIVAEGDEGMLLAYGPNRFMGYINDEAKTAEAIQDGWYVTGDRATVDREGFVRLKGRANRRCKPLGEDVSLDLLEEKLSAATGDPVMRFGAACVQFPKGERIVLLRAKAWQGDVAAILAKAQALGVPPIGIPKLEDVHEVDELPTLSEGLKPDVQNINKLAKKLSGVD